MANGIRKSALVRRIAQMERAFTPAAVSDAWGRSPARRLQLVCLDGLRYFGLPLGLWRQVLQYTGVETGQYREDRYDCDDFAMAFKGVVARKLAVNGVGFIVDASGQHAYNALLTVEQDGAAGIAFLEPQSDRLVVNYTGQYALQAGFSIW